MSIKNFPKCKQYIKYETQPVTRIPNTNKRVENKKHDVIFLTTFEAFGNVLKHCLGVSYNIVLIQTKAMEKAWKYLRAGFH